MGIFEDEAARMAAERAEQTRGDSEREAEGNAAAREIKDELVTFMARNIDAFGDSDVSVRENRIVLTTSKAPRRTFEIICESRENFRVKETTGFQTRIGQPQRHSERDVISRSEMCRWVIERLRE